MKLFLIKLSLFSLVIGGCNFWFEHYAGAPYAVKHLWTVFAFFVFTTALFHLIITKAAEGNAQRFIRKYMGITAFKLFLLITIVLAYLMVFGKRETIPFAIAFMAHYFLYTIFEVVVLLKGLKARE